MIVDLMSGLFINAAILISSIALGFMSLEIFLKEPSVRAKKIFLGIAAGAVGCLLMLYSVRVNTEQIIDLRIIPVILVGLYYSNTSSIIAVLIINTFRLIWFDITSASIIAIAAVSIITVFLCYVSRLNISYLKKWTYLLLANILVSMGGFGFFMNGPEFWDIIIPFFIGTVTIGTLTYHMMNYLIMFQKGYNQVIKDSSRDYLTGLYNSRQFYFMFAQVANRAEINNKPVSMLFLDIDNFKEINDQYGHIEGDSVLRKVSTILLQTINDAGIVARLGGDEFVVLFENHNHEKTLEVSEMIKNEVRDVVFTSEKDKQYTVHVTIGAASYPETVENMDDLIRIADEDLYKNKVVSKA